ncbi:TIGR02594 family protein [Kingella oralis]|uniref:TIGR02594 family protein n=1 Tax=Kingella oralis TaxID=505 RepID=UPI0034E4D3F6
MLNNPPQSSEPEWLAIARRAIGTTEIAGKEHNSTIRNWLISLNAWWTDDETPWCGTFVAHCAREADRALPKYWYRAKDWLNTGTRLDKPAYGCVVVFDRAGGGHVGFVVGKDKHGNLMVLGGNQGNAVNIKPFAISRVAGFIWLDWANGRKSTPKPERFELPLLDSNGAVSRDER